MFTYSMTNATLDHRLQTHTWDWKLTADPLLQLGVKAVVTFQQMV